MMTRNKKIVATVMALGMVTTAFSLMALAASPHTWHYFDTVGWADPTLRNSQIDGCNPNGGSTRWWVVDTPGEVNTNVGGALGGLPYPGMSDWVGIAGQTLTDYYSIVQTAIAQTEPTVGEPCINILEKDPNMAANLPDVYYDNGVEEGTGTVPHGYIWGFMENFGAAPDQEVCIGASPPTTWIEPIEMPAITYAAGNFNWAGVTHAPTQRGNTNACIAQWSLYEGPAAGDNNGPWTLRGTAAFGAPIAYVIQPGFLYCARPIWNGGVLGLVLSQPGPPAGDTATVTATIPVIGTPTADTTPQITYTSTGNPASVTFYWTSNGGTTWNAWDTDAAPGPSPGPKTFQTTTALPGSGTYGIMAKSPSEAVPAGAASIEVTPYIVDVTPPTVLSTTPAADATGVAINANVVVVYSESMQGTPTLTRVNGTAGVLYVFAGWSMTNVATDTATFTHAIVWGANAWQGVVLGVGTAADLVGNAPAAGPTWYFKTLDPTPPQTTINSEVPDPYAGQLPTQTVLTVTGDDTGLGNSNVIAAEYRVDAGAWIAMTPVGAPAIVRQFTATISVHNWTLANHNIEARASDGGWDATPAADVYPVGDTTPPLATILSPTDETHYLIGAGAATVTGTFEDFRLVLAATMYYAVAPGPPSIAVPMTYILWAQGSNIATFTAVGGIPEPAAATHYVFNIQATDPNGNLGVSPTWDLYYDEASAAPNFPYAVKGFSQFYNGSHAVGYNPFNQTGASVTVETINATGVHVGPLAQVTDALARYLFTLQPSEYAIGGLIWVNFTFGTYFNYSTTVSALDGGESWVNGTFGIPANMTITFIPWWDGLGVVPPTNQYLSGQPFFVNITIYDAYGNIAPGYYCYMQIDTNETSAGQNLWGMGVGPQQVAFDGYGGALTDGYYNNTCTLQVGGIWAMYVNATDGAGTPLNNLTWWDAALPNGPQYSPAITWEQVANGAANAFNYTHVQILAGGFYWRPVAGWNVISVPKNVSATLLTVGQFMASTAGTLVQAAAAGALPVPLALTECSLARHVPGTYPAVYEVWDVMLASGTDFALDIDYAYWLWVDVDMSAEGVFVQGQPSAQDQNGNLELGYGQITAAGINDVTLNARWTMVNPCAGWSNNSAWAVGTALHIDSRGNSGIWSAAGEILTTGGGWIAGVHHAWYSQAGIPANALLGQDDNPGVWVNDQNVIIQDCAAWYPSNSIVVDGTYTMNAYDYLFFGVQNMASAGCNQAQRLNYAGGFFVYSAGGGVIQYDIDYNWALPASAAPYTP